ncbi:prepilin peptidase [Suipraeoptans intestinalis]|nr:prepilin peptidase [Suipraeoptans intestinalis]
MWELDRCVCGILLGTLAVLDYKKKQVPISLLAIGGVLALCFCIGEGPDGQTLAGGAVGSACLLLSKVTGEQIGYGDSIGILEMGIYLGGWNLLQVLLLAFFFWGSGQESVWQDEDSKKRCVFPFIPFYGWDTACCGAWKDSCEIRRGRSEKDKEEEEIREGAKKRNQPWAEVK